MASAKRKKREDLVPRLAAYSASATAALAMAPAANGAIQDITSFTITGGSSMSSTVPSVAWGDKIGSGISSDGLFFEFAGKFKGGIAGSFSAEPARTVSGTNHLPAQDNLFADFAGRKGQGTNAGYLEIANSDRVIAQNLAIGAAINGKNFSAGVFGRGVLANSVTYKPQDDSHQNARGGNFLPGAAGGVKTGYIGFKAENNGQSYYGWLRVKVTNESDRPGPGSITLLASADDPDVYGAFGLKGDDITAGELASVPEPSALSLSGLGLLALGAAGIREMRRRKSATQPPEPAR